jgi:hypothetical protein
MNNSTLLVPTAWLDWLAVLGYLSLTVFIMWRILAPKE